MNSYLLMITFRIWLCEIAVSGFNYFVLMKRVYEPRIGVLRAHRIGMTTRIIYIFLFRLRARASRRRRHGARDAARRDVLAGAGARLRVGRELHPPPLRPRDPRRLARGERLHVAIRPRDALPVTPDRRASPEPRVNDDKSPLSGRHRPKGPPYGDEGE